MSELVPKDPQLAGVVDKQSQRNLLDPSDPEPLKVVVHDREPAHFGLEIVNGPEGLIELAISADEVWLQPESTRLTLLGGEKRDVICTANPMGDAHFANLLLSWKGTDQTLCQSVMIMRSWGDDEEMQEREAALKTLTKLINRSAKDDFINVEREDQIFREGGTLGLTTTDVESLLHLKCKQRGWTRQRRLTEKLTALLEEATKDDGVIDKQEFTHVVNFAVTRNMRRREAVEHCVTIVLDNAWRIKGRWWWTRRWWNKLRRETGL